MADPSPFPVEFQHPCTILVAGPTGGVKTRFVERTLLTRKITPFPSRLVWVYSEMQPAYEDLVFLFRNQIDFINAEQLLDDPVRGYDSFKPETRNLLVLDDQLSDSLQNKRLRALISRIFTQGSHHKNLSVILIVQNMYEQAQHFLRTLNLNTHYTVLFNNPRDNTQIRTLASQMFPKHNDWLLRSFEKLNAQPFAYLVFDCKNGTPKRYRVRTNIFGFPEVATTASPLFFFDPSAI